MTKNYHLIELEIALNPSDPRHTLPTCISAQDCVLDIGCGAGQTLIATFAGNRSYGVDKNLNALLLGKSLTKDVRFVCARAEALPFASGAFTKVISRVTLPYTNIPIVLREMKRVLVPGGHLWLTLHSYSLTKALQRSERWSWPQRAYVLANSLLLHFFQTSISYQGKYESFQTNYGIVKALRKAEFHEILVTRTVHFLVTARTT